MKKDIYKVCPRYENEKVILRCIEDGDANELLKCYSDKKAVQIFNSDNCTSDFHYKTIEEMREAMRFWKYSYEEGYFIRFTIVHKETEEKIGTVEMFRRERDDQYKDWGVLRIDLRSDFEKDESISGVLNIVDNYFFDDFGVETIITKAVEVAECRRETLRRCGYMALGEGKFAQENYFIKRNCS